MLINGRAGRIQRRPALVERIRSQLPATQVAMTHDVSEVAPALERLRSKGVETLVVVGGDGSATGTLTPLLEVWPRESLPDLLLAGGGTVNTVAKSLGIHDSPDLVLRRLLAGAKPERSERAPIRISVEGEKERYAMIFVCGAPMRFLEFYYEHSAEGVTGATYSLLACMGSIAVNGKLARELFRPCAVVLHVDGERSTLEQATILAASAVRDVGLGFKPFLTAGETPDRFHWLASAIQARALARRIPSLRLGSRGMLSDFEHASARQVEIRLQQPLSYSLDADLFPARSAFRIEAGPILCFLSV